jgi:1-acyl-sn-glycerol-3-phosphate acyltransferase
VLYRILQPLTLVLFRLLFRFRAVGLEHVPEAGPVLLAANHVSLLDPPAIGAAIRRPIHFLAKRELFRVPLLGGVIRRLNAHPVDRSGSDSGALRLALSLLAKGHGLLVFPEGTRGTGETLGAGKAGVGMLAALAGAPVVPVYIRGTERALPRGAWCPRPASVQVVYGPPLRFAGGRGRDRYQAISDEIMAGIGRLKDATEPGTHPIATSSRSATHSDRTAPGRVPAGQIH